MSHLTPALVSAAVIGVLCVLLLGAVWSDVKSYRIPNRLVFAGAAIGLLFNTVLPEGSGFISALPGATGFWSALAGLGLGLGLMLPLYVIRAMGAGDVKLMAMVGAFLGPNATLNIVLITFIIGGVLTLLVVMRNGTVGRLIDNLRTMLVTSFFKMVLREMPTLDAAPVSAGKLPYGVAIAAGTLAYFLLARGSNVDFLRFF